MASEEVSCSEVSEVASYSVDYYSSLAVGATFSSAVVAESAYSFAVSVTSVVVVVAVVVCSVTVSSSLTSFAAGASSDSSSATYS